MNTIGSRIKEIRKDNKLTQEQFGKKIGLKDSAISMLERNERSLTEAVIKNILTEFCVTEGWIKEGIGEKYSQELLKKKTFFENKPTSLSAALINKQLTLFNKVQSLGDAQQEEFLNVLDNLYSSFCNSGLGQETCEILSDDEYELLCTYRKLSSMDRNEILSFINFKNSTSDSFKKKQKLLTCAHDEEAATVQSKIG